MSDFVELVLDGILCEGCGVYMGDAQGYPSRCNACCEETEEESNICEDEI